MGIAMFTAFIFLGMLLGLLTNSHLASTYVLEGLKTWYQNAIPALFPFMVVSGLMIRLGLAESVSKCFMPVLGHLYQAKSAACYVILIGFLCGFPMGARTIAELYERNRLTKKEGKWLLAFCNNLSPAYVTGVLFPMLGIRKVLPCLFVFYGIPMIYGWILRRIMLSSTGKEDIPRESQILPQATKARISSALGASLRDSVESSVTAILMLGGYLAFFCLLNLFPHLIFHKPLPVFSLLLEVTTGLNYVQGKRPILCLCAATFGGLSCIAQTHAVLRQTDLSDAMGEYVIHKMILTAISLACYLALFRFTGL